MPNLERMTTRLFRFCRIGIADKLRYRHNDLMSVFNHGKKHQLMRLHVLRGAQLIRKSKLQVEQPKAKVISYSFPGGAV